jgi:hypothetical protein
LRRSERELFASFFEQMTGDHLEPAEQQVLGSVLAELDDVMREAES